MDGSQSYRRRMPVPRPWRVVGGPARTIRLRLTALYTSVYLVTGTILLTIGFLLVRKNLHSHHSLRAALARHGLHPMIGGSLGFPPGSPEAKVAHVVQQQIVNGALHRLLLEYVVGLIVMTAIAVFTGWLLAGRALAPLREITATARRVSGENLGERIALTGPSDELRELADTFDGMLGRLDAAFASQRYFVANASHELRTPLAIMRTEVDVALADPDASEADLRAMGDAVLESVDRCERLIASLLVLARSQATTGHEERVDVAALVGDIVTDLRAQADEAQISVRTTLRPAAVDADPGLLERLVANLVDNGIHHNVPGGFLTVSTTVDERRVRLVVANGGARIEAAEVEALTDPFRRLTRTGSGFGLGLSIVRSVAEAHGGTVSLTAPQTGGLVVTVDLPRPRAIAPPRPSSAEALRA
jgi:signal transduction histidine kinase